MDKKLYEEFTIRHGFTPESVLTMTREELEKIPIEKFRVISNELEQLYGLRKMEYRVLPMSHDGCPIYDKDVE